jgi:hypothetical protein
MTTSAIADTIDANMSYPRRIARFSFWFISEGYHPFVSVIG